MYIRNPETNEWKEVLLPPTGDTLPVGSVVEFDGDVVPTGWEKVEETNIITDGAPVPSGYKIDGKEVYMKRVSLGNLPNTSDKSVPHGLQNVTFIKYEGICYKANDIMTLPFASPYKLSNNIQISLTKQSIYILTGVDESSTIGYLDIYFVYEGV